MARLRFFGPNGALRATEEALSSLEQTSIGNLFGGADDIFAVTSNEEHAYNSLTEISFLPLRGVPKELAEVRGVYETFTPRASGQVPGVMIARQTYDGVHSETKGTVQEFWKWDPEKKSLTQQGK